MQKLEHAFCDMLLFHCVKFAGVRWCLLQLAAASGPASGPASDIDAAFYEDGRGSAHTDLQPVAISFDDGADFGTAAHGFALDEAAPVAPNEPGAYQVIGQGAIGRDLQYPWESRTGRPRGLKGRWKNRLRSRCPRQEPRWVRIYPS